MPLDYYSLGEVGTQENHPDLSGFSMISGTCGIGTDTSWCIHYDVHVTANLCVSGLTQTLL